MYRGGILSNQLLLYLPDIYKLHDEDPAIRQLAMRLVSNANESQLEACLRLIIRTATLIRDLHPGGYNHAWRSK
jgi:hypothetical protein